MGDISSSASLAEGHLKGPKNANVSEATTPSKGSIYLSSLLNKKLCISIHDGRKFVGAIKCTDRERNVVLDGCFEYRSAGRATGVHTGSEDLADAVVDGPDAEMVKRFVGMVVVPGEHIARIELAA